LLPLREIPLFHLFQESNSFFSRNSHQMAKSMILTWYEHIGKASLNDFFDLKCFPFWTNLQKWPCHLLFLFSHFSHLYKCETVKKMPSFGASGQLDYKNIHLWLRQSKVGLSPTLMSILFQWKKKVRDRFEFVCFFFTLTVNTDIGEWRRQVIFCYNRLFRRGRISNINFKAKRMAENLSCLRIELVALIFLPKKVVSMSTIP